MSSEVFDYVFTHPVLNKTIDILSLNQFKRQSETQTLPKPNIEELSCSELNKAVFLASVLACSEKEEHQQKAMSLAILSYLDNKNKDFASYCYIILSRVDVVQQGQHLHELVEDNKFLFTFDEALTLELSAKRALASLQLPGIDPIIISHFQRQLWNELQKADRIVAISGPTSSGKSYMVQNHIIELCKTKR